MKRWLITAGGLLALALVLTGLGSTVFAQEDAATPATEEDVEPREAYLETLSSELGVTVEELEEAMTNAELQMIDLWAEEARDHVESGGPLLLRFGGEFDGSFEGGIHIRDRVTVGMMGPGISISLGREAFGENVAGIAAFLGGSEDDLRADFRSGMTLVEIAEANGKTYDDLRAYLIEQATARIDEQLQRSSSETVETEDATGTPETSTSLTNA